MTPPYIEAQQPDVASGLPWRLEEIDFSKLEPERARHDDTLFFFLVMSSFVEAASDLYTRNLSAYYAGDHEVEHWLRDHWEHEEIQHGRALRTYVRAVWPEFDWERANAGFFAEYSAMCTLDEFEPTRSLEMAARCVVETGTSALYRAIHRYTDEPLLKELTRHIKRDEVRHFSYFYRFYQRYSAVEAVSRGAHSTRDPEAHRRGEERGFPGCVSACVSGALPRNTVPRPVLPRIQLEAEGHHAAALSVRDVG